MSGKSSKVLRRLAKQLVAPGTQERIYEQHTATRNCLVKKIDSKGRAYLGKGVKETNQVKLGYSVRGIAKKLKREAIGFNRVKQEGE